MTDALNPSAAKTEPVARIDIGTLRELLRFDPETGVLYWLQTRGKARKGGVAGRADHKGYLKLQIRKGTYAAHRIVWALHYGEWPSRTIDHINGQRADNRISNLRLATVTENNRNTKKRADNTSGYKGVSLNRKSGKFQAEIHVDGKTIYLGMYDTAEEAHRVYALKATEHFGEFGNVG